MNGSLAANAVLLTGIRSGIGDTRCDVAVCVPTPYLAQCRDALSGSPARWGAQDVSAHESGAFTGEVSAGMLLDFGSRYVIVGHSERRTYHGEADDLIATKAVRALSAGLTPIICVGETLQQREQGQTESTVTRQLDTVLASIEPEQIMRVVVAYEPVWAIGTGKTATPDMAQQVHALLRERLMAGNPAAELVPVLYGGSMKPDNAAELLAMPDIDGGLIGGAALKAADFLSIIRAC